MKTLITLLAFSLIALPAFAGSKYKIQSLETDISEGHFTATVYQPTDVKIKSILILTPTIAGVTLIEESNAQYFSKNGYLVIIPLPYKGEVENTTPDIAKLDADFLKPALIAESLITVAEKKYNLEPDLPVFALGASQGGIRTVIITSHNPRVKAAWFSVAGGDFASIYAYSTVEQIAAFRNNHMKFLGLTDVEVYRKYLEDNLTNDPNLVCKNIKVPFVQTIATRDDKVPTLNQELLGKSCPPHKIIRVKAGHVSGALTTVIWRNKIKKFFEASIK